MSAVLSYLLTWTPMRVTQELYRHAKDNAALRNRVFEIEHEYELFWMKAVERAEQINDKEKS